MTNEFETVDGMPVYYGGDFNDSDCEDPRDIAYEDWVEWCDFSAPDGFCGFFLDDGEARLPVTECAPVMVVGETTASVRLQQDSWDTSVSVGDIGTVETAEGFPVVNGGNYDEADYKDPRNEFETVDGMPVYYGGDLNDSDCEDPRDIDYEAWVDWCDLDTPERYCGVVPDDGETQLPVTDCASVMMEGDMAEPIRLRQDSWDASVSVANIDSGPVLDFLSPETVWGEGMELHMEREDSRTNDFQELPRDSSGPSCDLGVTGRGEPNILSQDNVVAILDVKVRSDMLCLLNCSCPGNSVRLPVVGGPHWMGMAHSRGAFWDPGGVCMPRLMVCCDCLALYRNILLCDHGHVFARPVSEVYWLLENN